MASGTIRITDVVVPEVFTPYAQQLTTEKSRLVQSGALVLSQNLSAALAGGGLTFNEPSYNDLDNDDDNVSSDDPAVDSTPNKLSTLTETQVRLSRNNSWSSMDLSAALSGDDPMDAIARLVAGYWTRRLQKVFIATMTGVFADNAAAPVGSEHVQGDLTHDVSGVFSDGVTNFSAEHAIDAAATMGDSADDLALMFVHPIVYARMRKNDLIDYIPDSQNPNGARIATFQGQYAVIVDNAMPSPSAGDYETWFFAGGAVQLGTGSPKVPTATERSETAGNGSGQETLHNRVEWIMHPVGHAYAGTAPVGGPSNANTTNNLAHAASWQRVFKERNQIKIARLITTEHA